MQMAVVLATLLICRWSGFRIGIASTGSPFIEKVSRQQAVPVLFVDE
jgi:hypothetical protein